MPTAFGCLALDPIKVYTNDINAAKDSAASLTIKDLSIQQADGLRTEPNLGEKTANL
jgi:hypothetical protein